MTNHTMRFKDVIESVYGTTLDPDDFEQSYDSFTFNGVTYGRLPVLNDPVEIGMGTYPIFNEAYRPILNGKIVDEYYNREIGTESIDDFKLIIRRKLDQIMPYYNKLYESELVEYGPLMTMDITSVSESEIVGEDVGTANTTSTSDTEAKARVVNSNTPQTMLRGSGDYASSATDTSSDSDVNSESESVTNNTTNSNTNSNNRVTGYQGIASDLMRKFRASLINIDTMILSDVEDCFMLVLTTGDSFSNNERWYF